MVGAVVGVMMTLLIVVAAVVQAARGNAVVAAERRPAAQHDAALDDAFYDCLSTQAHSLVPPTEPVFLRGSEANLAGIGDWVTMLKAIGSWVTFSGSPGAARTDITIEDHVTNRPACLGTVVVAREVRGGRTTVRFGSGAHVPGQGPPPAPQL